MKHSKNILEDLLARSKELFPDQQEQFEKKARELFLAYSKAENGKSKEITIHTVNQILPCIAFYKAVSEYTGKPEQAYAIIEEYFSKECALTAKKLQKLCGIPFVYKFVPRIMAVILHKFFGTQSGFEMIDRSIRRDVCHIDMIKCPYFSICSAHGYPELTTVFCNGDDTAYGNMHPRLSWERKKTLGRGDTCCDFILRIIK
ncbi:MAG: L-2-amino-thiazoline-4-carboxylic acid hydrolase [Oscillospiraceae bacterium]|nr:L-2-amino-thiazoline-4-carboxylic acid hydrolase [Oscillospiraceae bacterium]